MAIFNILIVEDEKLISIALRRTLEQYGYNVIATVDDADAAVNSVKELHPDLVIMDIGLKGEKSGIDASREIREFTDIPIIFATAMMNDEIIRAVKTINPASYLIKPYNYDELRANIEIALFNHSVLPLTGNLAHNQKRTEGGSCIGILDKGGHILFSSPLFEEVLDNSETSVLGKSIYKFLGPEESSLSLENDLVRFLYNRNEYVNGPFRLEILELPEKESIYLILCS